MQDAAIATLALPPRPAAGRRPADAPRRPPDESAGDRPSDDGTRTGSPIGAAAAPSDAAASESPAGRSVQLNRGQILDVTARCLRQQGYDATTIRRIAKELGCAVGSIYRYFRDKRELLTAVTEQLLLPAADLADEGLPFEEVARTYLKGAARDRSAYQLMFWLASLGDETSNGESAASEAASSTGNGNGNGKAGPDASDAQSAAIAAASETAPLPGVVERIIAASRPYFADADAGRHCWAALHGAVLLGMGFEQTLATLRPFLRTRAAGNGHARTARSRAGGAPSNGNRPGGNRNHLAHAAPTRPVTLDEEAAEKDDAEQDAEQPSDVCLL